MSVLPSDIVIYGCAFMPEADGSGVGGSVDFTKRVDFADLQSADTVYLISSSASDTGGSVVYEGRDSTGAQVEELKFLAGQTPVAGTKTIVNLMVSNLGIVPAGDIAILKNTPTINTHTAQAGSANATGITPALMKLQSGDGASVSVGQIIRTLGGTGPHQLRKIIATSGYGTDVVAVSENWSTVPDATTTYDVASGMLLELSPNSVAQVMRLFWNCASDLPGGSTRTYYEKVFLVNNNVSNGYVGASVQISADSPSLPVGASLDIGLASSFNDSVMITNRQTAPAGITFTTQPAPVSVPGSGALPPGAAPNSAGALAMWLRLTLPAGCGPYEGGAQFKIAGATT